MKKLYTYIIGILSIISFPFIVNAQTNNTISGNVRGSLEKQSLPAVSVIVKGSDIGTYTDDRGNFKIRGVQKLPVTLVFSSVGFADKEIAVTSASQSVRVLLDPVSALPAEVTVSASRLPESVLESPVTFERVSGANIRNAAAVNYYDMIANLKGVDIVTSSLNFKTPSTRGFNGSGNLRLNQLVEGMDNQSPGLNFSVGSMIGLTELDVENMELLSGASSALYGPGGMNGTLLINSKNPFKYQGLSVQVKEGIMHVGDDALKASAYHDFGLRYGRKLSEKFAFKIGGQYIQAQDWVGSDYRNYNRGNNPAKGNVIEGDRTTDRNYNGVNVYGDETSVDLLSGLKKFAAATPVLGVINLTGYGDFPLQTSEILRPYIGSTSISVSSFNVSRTGYKETDVIDPETKNVRISGGLFYKITPDVEASLSANWGSGTAVYTGSDRYNFKNFKIAQYKAEVRHKNWFVRAYTTREDAGKTYNSGATTQLFNEAWKSSTIWYPQFGQALIQGSAAAYGKAVGQAYAAALGEGQSPSQAAAAAQLAAPSGVSANQTDIFNAARSFADMGRPEAGSAIFRQKFDSVANRPINNGGGLFLDKSSLNMVEGQYNFSEAVKVAEVLVGGNFKRYVLNSEGTIFADTAGHIGINEVGAYALVSKRFFNDVLKLTASGRYDKNQNFKGRFTPRFSAVITVAKNNNIRLSYQTAYRFPSTQNQWINLVIGGGIRLIGGLPQLREHYELNTNSGYTIESAQKFLESAAVGRPDPALLVKQNFGEYKPESVTSYEAGYKTLINGRLLIDLYGYYSKYQNFIGRVTVLQSATKTPAGLFDPATTNIISVSVNSAQKVDTHGWGLSGEYALPNNFSVNANVYSDEITNVPLDFVAYFNTPKYRANIGLSNRGFLYKKRAGFTIQYRFQDAYKYENDFGAGDVDAFSTLDAQINFKFPAIKSMIKFGATNLTNHYYITAFGNPRIGALYYASYAYNIF
jgi:outer membrane receptor protein involved in Fe transport